MVPSASTTATMIAAALLVVAPAHAAQVAGIADFLTTIGGDTDMKTAGTSPADPSPQIYPLMHDGSEVIGYRLFFEKITANGLATAERTKAAFARECVAKGGRIEAEDSDVARGFNERVLRSKIPQRIYKHFWAGLSAVCSRSPSEVMGGFVAITFDTTEVATKGDMGSQLLSKIWLQPTRTAVYAYRPERIRTAVSFEARNAAILADYAAEQRANEAFQKDIVVGTETNCGTVIQVPWTDGRNRRVASPPGSQWAVDLLVKTHCPDASWARPLHLRPLTFQSQYSAILYRPKEKLFDYSSAPQPACSRQPVRSVTLYVERPRHRSASALCRQQMECTRDRRFSRAHCCRRMDDPGHSRSALRDACQPRNVSTVMRNWRHRPSRAGGSRSRYAGRYCRRSIGSICNARRAA